MKFDAKKVNSLIHFYFKYVYFFIYHSINAKNYSSCYIPQFEGWHKP